MYKICMQIVYTGNHRYESKYNSVGVLTKMCVIYECIKSTCKLYILEIIDMNQSARVCMFNLKCV